MSAQKKKKCSEIDTNSSHNNIKHHRQSTNKKKMEVLTSMLICLLEPRFQGNSSNFPTYAQVALEANYCEDLP